MFLIRWSFSLTILSVWCAFLGTLLYMAMYEPSEELPKAQAIIVLGGNPAENGVLTGESAARLAEGISLFDQGAAPILVVTGGNVPPVAQDMAKAALAAGIPEDAIVIEDKSRSTLQNALFTADIAGLDSLGPVILVTHRYHLTRAWASFRWAGFGNVTRHAADADTGVNLTGTALRESLKWPFNVARAAGASIASAAGVPRDAYIHFLE